MLNESFNIDRKLHWTCLHSHINIGGFNTQCSVNEGNENVVFKESLYDIFHVAAL